MGTRLCQGLGLPVPLPLLLVCGCALGKSLPYELSDASSFIQHASVSASASASASVQHPALALAHGPCIKTGPTWGWLSDADKLKKVLDDSTTALKMVKGLLLPHAAAQSQSESESQSRSQGQAQSQSRWRGRGRSRQESQAQAQAKAREGETRAAVREQFRALLQHFPKISMGVRGVLVGWAVPQIMEWRRSSGPAVRALIDDVAALGLFTSTTADLEAKASQLAQALQRSGFEDLAANVTVLLPSLRGISNIIASVPANAKGAASAAAILQALAEAQQNATTPAAGASASASVDSIDNRTGTKGLPAPVLRFAADVAGLLAQGRSPGEVKDEIPGRATQMFRELNVSVDARALSTLSEMVVGITPKFMHGDLHVMDLMPYLSRLLSESDTGRQFKALPVVLEFLSDLSAMNQAAPDEVDKGRILSRLARFLSDLDVFDQVGGPLGAIAGLTSDLAHLSSGSGGAFDERRAYLRFARLANELHLVNESMGQGLAMGFDQLAHASCSLLGPQAHSEVCAALHTQGHGQGQGQRQANVSQSATLLALQLQAATQPQPLQQPLTGRDFDSDFVGDEDKDTDERAGEVMGVLLSDAAVALAGGPLSLAQTQTQTQEQGHTQTHTHTPTHALLGALSLPVSDPCSAPATGSGEASRAAQKKKKRSQSPEAKRREPATRAALREKLGSLLSRLPSLSLPAMARGVAVNYLVPKLMELRRESDPAVQELIDRAAGLDFGALVPVLHGLGDTLSTPAAGGSDRDPARLAKLLQQAAQLAQLLGAQQQVPDFLTDLAHQVQSGHGDWADFAHSDAPQRLISLLKPGDASAKALNTTAELLRSYQRGDDAATLLAQATQLVEELDLLPGPRRQGIATALDRMALLACASSALAPHLTLCQVAGLPGPEAVAPATKAGTLSSAPAASQPQTQREPRPQVTWHRQHTER